MADCRRHQNLPKLKAVCEPMHPACPPSLHSSSRHREQGAQGQLGQAIAAAPHRAASLAKPASSVPSLPCWFTRLTQDTACGVRVARRV